MLLSHPNYSLQIIIAHYSDPTGLEATDTPNNTPNLKMAATILEISVVQTQPISSRQPGAL